MTPTPAELERNIRRYVAFATLGITPVMLPVLVLGLREVQVPAATRSWRAHLDGYRELIVQSARFVWRHRLVRWQVLFLGSLIGSNMWLLWLYQPYMQWSGLPVWAFGIAFTTFNLFAALVSQWPHRVEGACGRVGTVVLLVVLQLLPLPLLATWVAPASFLFILGHQAVRALAVPIVSARILRYTYADKRATVLSIGSMAARLFYAATAPAIGLVARQTSLAHTLWIQLVILAVLYGVLLTLYLRIPSRYFAVKETVRAQQ